MTKTVPILEMILELTDRAINGMLDKENITKRSLCVLFDKVWIEQDD